MLRFLDKSVSNQIKGVMAVYVVLQHLEEG